MQHQQYTRRLSGELSSQTGSPLFTLEKHSPRISLPEYMSYLFRKPTRHYHEFPRDRNELAFYWCRRTSSSHAECRRRRQSIGEFRFQLRAKDGVLARVDGLLLVTPFPSHTVHLKPPSTPVPSQSVHLGILSFAHCIKSIKIQNNSSGK